MKLKDLVTEFAKVNSGTVVQPGVAPTSNITFGGPN